MKEKLYHLKYKIPKITTCFYQLKLNKINKNTKDNFKGRVNYMLKNLAWNTFKKTGDINIYLEYIKIKNIEKNTGEINGDNKN